MTVRTRGGEFGTNKMTLELFHGLASYFNVFQLYIRAWPHGKLPCFLMYSSLRFLTARRDFRHGITSRLSSSKRQPESAMFVHISSSFFSHKSSQGTNRRSKYLYVLCRPSKYKVFSWCFSPMVIGARSSMANEPVRDRCPTDVYSDVLTSLNVTNHISVCNY